MTTYETIVVRPLTANIGAEIEGLDLSKPLDNRQSEELYRAFLEHHVVFLRGQDMTPEQHMTAGRLFGEICGIPFVKSVEGYPEIVEIVKEAEERKTYNFGGNWHTDMTFLEEPSKASVLYGLEVPAAGGDTKFASTTAAYEALSPVMKDILEGLTALHTAGRSYGKAGKFAGSNASTKSMQIDASEDAEAEIEHPIVRVHPETGRKALYVNPNYTLRIKGMAEDESAAILNFLYAHMVRDEFTCRFRWTPGAVAIWDNRVTMHRAVNDYDGSRRVMHRVTIAGDRPVAAAAESTVAA